MSDEQRAREVIAASEDEERLSLSAEVELTVKEYADLHRIHVQTVYTAIRYGRRLHGRVARPTPRSIRIVVPRHGAESVRPVHKPTRGIYFAKCGDFVKIGLAADVARRFRVLGTLVPFPVQLLGVIEVPLEHSLRDAEQEYHRRFAALRHAGEWFRYEGELATFCDAFDVSRGSIEPRNTAAS